MSQKMSKKSKVKGVILSIALGLFLFGAIAGMVFMILQPISDDDVSSLENIPKISLEAEAPTSEEMVIQTEFSVGA